jgi:opacity protein-like surface antigen
MESFAALGSRSSWRTAAVGLVVLPFGACEGAPVATLRWLDGQGARPDALGVGFYAEVDRESGASIALQAAASGVAPAETEPGPVVNPTGRVEHYGYEILLGPGYRPTSWLQLHATAGVGWGRTCEEFYGPSPPDDYFWSCRNDAAKFGWSVGGVAFWPDSPGPAIELGYDDFFGGIVVGLGIRF